MEDPVEITSKAVRFKKKEEVYGKAALLVAENSYTAKYGVEVVAFIVLGFIAHAFKVSAKKNVFFLCAASVGTTLVSVDCLPSVMKEAGYEKNYKKAYKEVREWRSENREIMDNLDLGAVAIFAGAILSTYISPYLTGACCLAYAPVHVLGSSYKEIKLAPKIS